MNLHAVYVAVGGMALGSLACGARSELSSGGGGSASRPPTASSTGGAGGCGLATPTMIALISPEPPDDGQVWVQALTVADGMVYAGLQVLSGPQNGHGWVERFSTSGGPIEHVTAGDEYATGPLSHDALDLFYPRPTFGNSTLVSHGVSSRPLAGGPAIALPNPTSAEAYVTDVAGLDQGVAWLLSLPSGQNTHVARWDGTTSAVVVTLPDYAYRLVVVGPTAFAASSKALFATPIAGGTESVVHAMTSEGALLAGNATSVFFSPDGSTIVRRDAGSGVEDIIAEGITISSRRAAHADAHSLYFASTLGLERVSTDGGGAEHVGTPSFVESIAGDDCNVYWAATESDSTAQVSIFALGKQK